MTLSYYPSSAHPSPAQPLAPALRATLATDLREEEKKAEPPTEPPSHIVRLQTESPLWKKDRQEQVQRAAEGALDFLARHHKTPSDTALIVSILCTDEQRMRSLNRRFRNKDSACDSLAFPAASSTPSCGGDDGLHGFLGDIALGYQGLERTIEQHRLDALAHCAHMTIHGVLHLAGFLHDGDKTRAAMEKAEETILAQLGFVDLHPLALP